MTTKSRQINVRVLPETDLWLGERAGDPAKKADFVRRLIEREMARDREENLLEVFNKAAAELTDGDRAERNALLGAFAANEETPKRAKGRK